MIYLHTYFLINISIAIGFIISKVFFLLYQKGSQWQKLQFMRNTLMISMVVFFLIPEVMAFIPANLHSTFAWDPFLKMNSDYSVYHPTMTTIEPVPIVLRENNISMKMFLILIWTIGFAFFILTYIKNIIFLRHFLLNALCCHKIGKIQILISEKIDVPFCFRFLKYHYVMLPLNFLENSLARQHELQHIRQGDTIMASSFVLD